MIGWGLADFFAKKTIDEIGDVASLALGHIFGTLTLFLAVLYQFGIRNQELIWPAGTQVWSLLVIFGIGQALVYLVVYRGFSKGHVGVLSPIFASFTGITALLSILVFKEVVSGYIGLVLLVIFIGILLINADWQSLRARKLSFVAVGGFREIALATLMAAVWTLFWARFLGGQDWLMYTFLMYTFMTITIYIIAKLQKVKLVVQDPSMWKFLILIGVTETLAYIAISIGYSLTTRTSVVALLSGAFSLPTIILARMFLHEKITGIQTVGGLVIIAGIMILALI